jgi:hypothetical protein
VDGERTISLTALAAETTVVRGADDPQTVQLPAPAMAGSPLVVPRQREALDDTVVLTAAYSPQFPLPSTVATHITLPRQPSEPIVLPQLPIPASAEELAVERLRLADDDESDPHLVRMLMLFFLALAIAVGAGYLMATSLSGDIQAFFNSIMRGS